MIPRLARSEPHVLLTVRLPRIKSKDEVLRGRADAYVCRTFMEHYGANDAPNQLNHRRELRVVTLMKEREAVLAKMATIPRRRVFLRRLVFQQLLERHGIAKWW